MQHFLSVGHITNFRHLAWPHEKFSFFMYTMNCMMGKNQRVLARATLNGLASRVVARGPPVAHPWCKVSSSHRTTRCKIHWILQARATNTISHDCIPVILFLYSERIQHRSTTVVGLTGVQGCEPPPWQDDCKNWAPILLIFRYSVLFWFSVSCCFFALFGSFWTAISGDFEF